MLPALLAVEPEKVFALPDHSLADDDFKLMATLSDLADRELVATIGWAKQVPGKPVLSRWLKVSRIVILVICPIAIAYSMGQIIKSVCFCVCVSVCLSVCEHSHGRIS